MMKRIIRIIGFTLFVVTIFSLEGCQKLTIEEKEAAGQIQRMLTKGFTMPSQIRAHITLTQWENGSLDPQPILIDARLVTPKGKQDRVLLLAISDEDGDIKGIGIRERKLSPDGKEIETLEEQYPIYEYFSPMKVSYEIIPVEIRTSNQRKDENLWREYINGDKSINNNPPPIWISFPQLGEMEVQVWLYDKAGRESKPVDIIEFNPN